VFQNIFYKDQIQMSNVKRNYMLEDKLYFSTNIRVFCFKI